MKLRFATLTRSTLATAAALALGAASAHAHPGHGVHGGSLGHILSSPYHLAVLAFIGAVLLLAARFVHRRWPRRVIQGTAIAALATTIVLCGLHS
jgi:hypothetical protein